MKTQLCLLPVALFAAAAAGQGVLFDFDSAAAHTPLPITLSVAGLTAHFSGSGQGYSIQAANTMGFTPLGFSGNCIYPSSVYASDLTVSFSPAATNFSVLYAPQELACDSSATMRVTAYLDAAEIGTATTNAVAGTWPSEILQFGSAQAFNRVVVHYDKAPVTGGDYGCIFLADNVTIWPVPVPVSITHPKLSPNGTFSFDFYNAPAMAFTVLAATNPCLPAASWTPIGPVSEVSPGAYQFTDSQTVGSARRFYRVTSP